jgi:hypothetical protein
MKEIRNEDNLTINVNSNYGYIINVNKCRIERKIGIQNLIKVDI